MEIEEPPGRPALLRRGETDDLTKAPGWGLDGAALHAKGSGVPPERWCLTKKDLMRLRRAVEKEVEAGRLTPHDRDPFDPNDDEIGPNMYTVVDQYIKPLTHEAGCMSYALLRHPEGLACGVFVTHAWAEGVYEFIDKVLESWPCGGGSAAWICVFANPQNLDISELISDPQASPFAAALRSATHMLVVPNRTASIYTRIWCAYEAYLAWQWDKTILTARPSTRRTVVRHTLMLLSCSLAAFVLAYVAWAIAALSADAFAAVVMIPFFATAPVLLMSLYFRKGRIVWAVNICGCVVAAALYAGVVEKWFRGDSSLLREATVYLFIATFYFIMSQADRTGRVVAEREQAQLRAGYSGGVEDAQCSNEEDRHHIFSNIGHDLDNVNAAVEVLQQTGMSTSALRKAHALGIPLTGAREVIWRFYAFLSNWPIWVAYQTCWTECDGEGYGLVGPALSVLSWAVVFYHISSLSAAAAAEDDKVFIVTVLAKTFMLYWLTIALVSLIATPRGELEQAMWYATSLTRDLASLLFARNRGAVLRLPLLGPRLAKMLGPGLHGWCGSRRDLASAALLPLALVLVSLLLGQVFRRSSHEVIGGGAHSF